MVDWMGVGRTAFIGLIIVFVAFELRSKIFPAPSKGAKALADKLGLRHERNVWKGTERWVGTWDRMPVQMTLPNAEEPSILIGDFKGAKARWMLMDRKLEADLVPLKDEPTPVPTGDKRFDERFNLRVYGTGRPSDVTSSMRTLLLDASPEIVTVWPNGLEYHIGGDLPTAPKAKRHLEAATELARMAGISPRPSGQVAEGLRERTR